MPTPLPPFKTLFAVSTLVMILFISCGVWAYLQGMTAAVDKLTDAVIYGWTTIIGFWFGSSWGSQKKDHTLASQLPPPPVTAVAVPVPQPVPHVGP